MSVEKFAFIGLGRMGYPMAGHLRTAGHQVTVFDIFEETVDRWVAEHGGQAASSPREAAAGASIVFTSLPADAHLRTAAYGDDGIFAGLETGAVWVDHTTASVAVSRELAAAATNQGAGFLDAPVSGGVQGAVNGGLTIMVGGADESVTRALPFIELYASLATHLGPSGAGQLTKMANQICVVGLCQALAEGLDFAESAGLDVAQVISVMLKGSSTSWQMENRAETMLAGEYDFGFATPLMQKDIALCMEAAREMAVPLPITSMVGQFLADVERMGGQGWDWSSLMERQRSHRSG